MDLGDIFQVVHVCQNLPVLVQRLTLLEIHKATIRSPLLDFLDEERNVHARLPDGNAVSVREGRLLLVHFEFILNCSFGCVTLRPLLVILLCRVR